MADLDFRFYESARALKCSSVLQEKNGISIFFSSDCWLLTAVCSLVWYTFSSAFLSAGQHADECTRAFEMVVLHIQHRAVLLDKAVVHSGALKQRVRFTACGSASIPEIIGISAEFSEETATNPVCKKSQVEGLRSILVVAATQTYCCNVDSEMCGGFFIVSECVCVL